MNTCCTTGRTEKFDYSIILFPGFSLLPRERTLVAAGHVTFCDNGLLIGVEFSKTLELWSSKANWCFRFSLPSIISADLLGNRVYVLPHPWGSWGKTTVGATWLAATRVLSQGKRENLETRLLVLIIYVGDTATSKIFITSKTSSIKKKIVRYTEDFVI